VRFVVCESRARERRSDRARSVRIKRPAVAVAMSVALALCVAPAGVVTGAELGGSLRVDLEASETSQVSLAGLTWTTSLEGGSWRTTGRVTLADGEFSSIDLLDERTVGPLQLRSTCVFDPDIGFSYLGSTARFALLETQLNNYAFLSHDPALSYDQLTMRWAVGGVTVLANGRVGLCPLEFRGAQTAIQWYISRCDLFMDVRTAFRCGEGFDYLRMTGRFPRVPFLSNDLVETELRLTLQLETDRKGFTPSLRMRAGPLNACISPYIQVVEGATFFAFDGVELYGWTIECGVGDAAEVLLATSLDPARNRELTGEADYWEVWRLRGAVPSCCDRSPQWELSTYFGDPDGSLFSWALTSVSVEIPLANRLTARFGSAFRATAPRWQLSAGAEIRF